MTALAISLHLAELTCGIWNVRINVGENQKEIGPSLKNLRHHGIGGILDYAAEDDVSADEGPASRNDLHDTVVARTFAYENEAKCDHHTGTFLKNIQAASDAPGQGFAAIKVQQTSYVIAR